MCPIASSARPTCEPRIVAQYCGVHIADLGSHLEVVFTERAKLGIAGLLRANGWQIAEPGHWRKASCPASIMQAQEILGMFYGGES